MLAWDALRHCLMPGSPGLADAQAAMINHVRMFLRLTKAYHDESVSNFFINTTVD